MPHPFTHFLTRQHILSQFFVVSRQKTFFYLRFIILNRNQIDANLRRRKLERSEQNEAEVIGPKLQFTES